MENEWEKLKHNQEKHQPLQLLIPQLILNNCGRCIWENDFSSRHSEFMEKSSVESTWPIIANTIRDIINLAFN